MLKAYYRNQAGYDQEIEAERASKTQATLKSTLLQGQFLGEGVSPGKTDEPNHEAQGEGEKDQEEQSLLFLVEQEMEQKRKERELKESVEEDGQQDIVTEEEGRGKSSSKQSGKGERGDKSTGKVSNREEDKTRRRGISDDVKQKRSEAEDKEKTRKRTESERDKARLKEKRSISSRIYERSRAGEEGGETKSKRRDSKLDFDWSADKGKTLELGTLRGAKPVKGLSDRQLAKRATTMTDANSHLVQSKRKETLTSAATPRVNEKKAAVSITVTNSSSRPQAVLHKQRTRSIGSEQDGLGRETRRARRASLQNASVAIAATVSPRRLPSAQVDNQTAKADKS